MKFVCVCVCVHMCSCACVYLRVSKDKKVVTVMYSTVMGRVLYINTTTEVTHSLCRRKFVQAMEGQQWYVQQLPANSTQTSSKSMPPVSHQLQMIIMEGIERRSYSSCLS